MKENWLEISISLAVVAAFLRFVIPKIVTWLEKKNEKQTQEIDRLHKGYKKEIEDLIEQHKRESKESLIHFTSSLEAKDEQINTLVEQFGSSLHEMSQALEKQTKTVVDMREEFRPLKNFVPLMEEIVEKVNQLAS